MKRLITTLCFLILTISLFSQKISDLPAATTVNATDLLPIVQSGVTKKTTASQVVSFIRDSLDNVRIISDTCLEVSYKGLLDTICFSSQATPELELNDLSDVTTIGADSWDFLRLDDESNQWIAVSAAEAADSLAASGGGAWITDEASGKLYTASETADVIIGDASIDVSGYNNVSSGSGNVLDTVADRGDELIYSHALGYLLKIYNRESFASGLGCIADGHISVAMGNSNLCRSNDGSAMGNRTVSGRKRYAILAHGIGSSTGVISKAYVVVDSLYGNIKPYFPNALSDEDSLVSWYGSGVEKDVKGNIYASGHDTAIFNPDGTVNTYNDLKWAMHSYCVIKSSVTEYGLSYYRILKVSHTSTGDTIFYNSATEAFSGNIESIYSSYAPTLFVKGIQGGNGIHTFGFKTSAWGYGSLATGVESNAWAYATFVAGGYNFSNAIYSAALGYHTRANSWAGLAIGAYNVGGNSKTGRSSGDFIFEVGNGTSETARSNAFSVTNTGVVTVSNYLSTPILKLPTSGTIKINDIQVFHNKGGWGCLSAGNYAGNTLTTGGNGNTYNGYECGFANATGTYNDASGYRSQFSATGTGNTSSGAQSLYSLIGGSNNTAFGFRANYLGTGSGTVWIGNEAGNNAAFAALSNVGGLDNSNTATPLLYFDFSANNVTTNGTVVNPKGVLADNDLSPSVAGGNIWEYAGTSTAISIDALDSHVVGAIYTIIGSSNTNTITIIDGTPSGGDSFNLAGANWVGGNDDVLMLYCISADNFIEISRSDN